MEPIRKDVQFLNIVNFLSLYLILIKLASKCMVCQDLSCPILKPLTNIALPFKGDWIHLVDLLPFLQGRQLLQLPVCFSAHHIHSENGSTLKGKNLLPKGSKFLSFRVGPFSEWRQNHLTELPSEKLYPFLLIMPTLLQLFRRNITLYLCHANP